MKNVLVFIVLSVLSGAAMAQYNPYVYHQGLNQQNVIIGTVVADRSVTGQGGSTLGRVFGGVAGAAAGNRVGHGFGRQVSTLAGALIGGLVGGDVQQHLTAQQAENITVQLQDGRYIAVVEASYIPPGTKVQVVYQNNGKVRVFPL
ncbi:glycine zipper 2TM domain-containing protein [Acidihalobacter ferrooxydans]|uniref:Glycine zipper 2TM domain-containing protein n=1 Tax=Acidihalobacter ferrooxydans TaxID=1765967 RepID=A0A1P8UFN0_9GAMM|nr:glycine zipper 2TM domain-containing protein [Acidihalobacter ferrooxydans]APZ42609.1 hypothetical protein BW247_05450 [Acidihalobacter ferrooxydans]